MADVLKKSGKNKRSSNSSSNPFSFALSECLNLFQSMGLGVFYLADKFLSLIINIIGYIIVNVFDNHKAITKKKKNSLTGEITVNSLTLAEDAANAAKNNQVNANDAAVPMQAQSAPTKKKSSFSITNEIVLLFSSFMSGIQFIFNYIISIFALIYKKIAGSFKNTVSSLNTSINNINENISGKKGFFERISDYIKNKYNNIPYVKESKRKYEESLIPIELSPDGPEAIKTEKPVTYKYTAKNNTGKIVTNYFSAMSIYEVYLYLVNEGMTVYEITTSWSINFMHSKNSSTQHKMKTKDLIFWLTQIATYVKAGIPLTDAVKVLSMQDKRPKYQPLYQAIIFDLSSGNSFSEALKRQGNVFPQLLVNMIKSSELIGNIEETLDEMSAYYQEIEDTKKAIVSALTYPAIVMTFALGVVIFMLVYIIPQFESVYTSMGAEVNALTATIIKISKYLKAEYLTIIMYVVLVVLVYLFLYKKVKAFKTMMQRFFMKLPGIGKLIIYKEMSLFAKTFSTLTRNNILLTDSISILGKITNNEIYKTLMFNTINNLVKGEKMSESFKDHWAVPDVAYFMIATGEGTGELAEMLSKVGEFYQKQERTSVATLKTLIEPLMIGGLAIVVGVILVSILIPMFGIYNTIA